MNRVLPLCVNLREGTRTVLISALEGGDEFLDRACRAELRGVLRLRACRRAFVEMLALEGGRDGGGDDLGGL